MTCKICGKESGKYILCTDCNSKRDSGEVIKCHICNQWHYATVNCTDTAKPSSLRDIENTTMPDTQEVVNVEIPVTNEHVIINEIKPDTGAPQMVSAVGLEDNTPFLYSKKSCLLTKSEQNYYEAIKANLPNNLYIHPQANLATFINRDDNARYQNELYRNVDFLITDNNFTPLFVIEINDNSHNTKNRKVRDCKVNQICEEAGVPIIVLWTTYGINSDYINMRIREVISSLPVKRIHHFTDNKSAPPINQGMSERYNDKNTHSVRKGRAQGCYIASCVYGSYDCPQVWTLRRFRDNVLKNSFLGRLFIKAYYLISPNLIKLFGKSKLFKAALQPPLDLLVRTLKNKKFSDAPYID